MEDWEIFILIIFIYLQTYFLSAIPPWYFGGLGEIRLLIFIYLQIIFIGQSSLIIWELRDIYFANFIYLQTWFLSANPPWQFWGWGDIYFANFSILANFFCWQILPDNLKIWRSLFCYFLFTCKHILIRKSSLIFWMVWRYLFC